MKFIFLRHGEAEHNVKAEINQDASIRVRLTEFGKRQAKSVSEDLENRGVDIIFISEFLRTRETAEIIKEKLGIPMKVDKRINEFRVGFEGEKTEVYRDAARRSGKKRTEFRLEGYENFIDVIDRVREFIEDVRNEDYEGVLVVTHETVVQAAKVILDDYSADESYAEKVKNCEFIEKDI